MAESLEEARFVERFLIKVSSGTDFTPDIWIERDVKSSGPGGEDTKATSYSGKKVGIKINNLTELLKDDLDHCFRKNYFVFRFISAIAGSGKTTLLSYLQELIEVDYDNGYVVVNSPLPAQTGALTSVQSFHARFYSHILTETLFQLLDKPKVQVVAEYILREILDQESSDQLIGAKDSRISFFTKFNNFTSNARIDLEGAFLTLIRKVLEVDADYAFVYLIDELDDALQEEPSQVQQVREAFKSLHNRTLKEFGDKVRLLVYVAGTSEKLKGLIDSDTAINRRFVDHTIHLGLGVKSEFSKIREKIDKRLEGAYRGCDSFDEAQAKIQDIDNQLKSTYVGKIKSIGSYCKNYAYAALEIYEEYFSDKTEKHFEGSNKQLKELISSTCKDLWKQYLDADQSYKLLLEEISDNSNDHVFMCYATLCKGGSIVARAYGGFRNYEVTIDYVDDFIKKWDEKHSELSSRQIDSQNNPSNIAFLVSSEGASSLIEKKLELKEIRLIDSSNSIRSDSVLKGDANKGNTPQSGLISDSNNPVDVNLASEEALVRVFSGTIVRKGIVGKIIAGRPYETLKGKDETLRALSKIKGIGPRYLEIIRSKLDSNEICFRIGAFISYNSQDKAEVNRIVAKLRANKILCWTDEQLPAGKDIRRELEAIIKSDQIWAAIIFYGNHGPGRWQDQEISSLFKKYVHRKNPVIPVVLSNCQGEPQISVFLGNLNYVDFRKTMTQALESLIDSIKHEVG